MAYVFEYKDPNEQQSLELQELLTKKPLPEVIAQVTGLEDQNLIAEIEAAVEAL